MKITKNIEHYDTFSLLENRYEIISNKLAEAEKIALDLLGSEMKNIEYPVLKSILDSVYPDINITIKLEEAYLYPELKNILPEQTSIDALREEHKIISEFIYSIKKNLENKIVFFCNLYNVQLEIIGLYDIMQRNIHKKENILFYEAQGLSGETLDKIYADMSKKLNDIALVKAA